MSVNSREDYKKKLERELRRIVRRLKVLGAEKIILFGSYARGRTDAFTDLDLIVIMRTEAPYLARTAYVYRQLAPRVAADILVYTPAEWEQMQARPFIKKALAEGRVLYEKAAPGRRG